MQIRQTSKSDITFSRNMTGNELNLPPFEAKLLKESGRISIYDMLRKRYVALTPEEYVRQHFVHYLCDHLGYPEAILANEVMLSVGQKHLRCDTVAYDSNARPRMIIEYKAPNIAITQKVFNQISAYNLLLKVDLLIVSNGLTHHCCKMDYVNQNYLFIEDIPNYETFLQFINKENK